MNGLISLTGCRIDRESGNRSVEESRQEVVTGNGFTAAMFHSGYFQAVLRQEGLGEGRYRLICEWTNISENELYCQLELRVQTDFPFTHYIIPGVSLNGNGWGKGKEPKSLACGGEPWVFDYRRTTIPACSVSENEENYMALFASDESAASLEASCSMVPQEDGTMVHRILYPCIERPKTYCTRDGYAPEHEGFLTIGPGKTVKTEAFLLTGRPVSRNYAMADVEDAALELLGQASAVQEAVCQGQESDLPEDGENGVYRADLPRRIYQTSEIADLACRFAQRLVTVVNGRKLFSIGQLPDGQGRFENRPGYEFGWCGQNGMYARLFLERGFEKGDQALIDVGVSNLDAWSHEAVDKTGLIHTHYHWMLSGESDTEDTCNLGFAIGELAQSWEIMRKYGIEKPDWLKAADGVAEFLVSHYSPDYGFGKSWNVKTGECLDRQGTIGAYVIPGLISLFHSDGEIRWLEAARRACRFYRDRDLAAFECTAGALDTYCIDKEPGGPLLAGSLALFEIDGTDEWLACAKMAGWYFCSWMFHHDIIARPDSDFVKYGYRTRGGTSVSVQHHHIDPWGALVVPQMIRLWKITGDEHWRLRAALMWENAVQNIAPLQGKEIHGLFREAGAQNEGYHHCCWGESGAPGYINDWLVAWPQAFCWNAAAKVTDEELKI